ncbi:trihelix transcription factor GT-3b-like [Musa acuminata AAA Group]|uniref:trihelix transcription factor GT-3b-like n=1 Tax=Musa acuminata AAA Group TaxID=214697 RepID=UPI0031DA5658
MELHPYLRVKPPQETSERFPQWTHDETMVFLAIRSQLDKSFVETKRNKPLWQAISSLLQQRGFFRTPDQCKSKWKNLVTRFKGSESVEGEINRQFPFYEEMRKIFSDRMERLLVLEKARGKQVQVQAKEWEEEEGEGKVAGSKKRRKVERKKRPDEEVEGAVRDFMRRQLEMEARWAEAVEARDAERRAKEEQWRRLMQGLQEERTDLERRWREREEERRVREETRAERRHALLIALLNKLVHKDF